LSVTPITRLQLPTSTLYHFKFTQCSVYALQQIEEDAKQHSIETTGASVVQLVEQLTRKLDVAGLNPSEIQLFGKLKPSHSSFFLKAIALFCQFLKSLLATRHFKLNVSRAFNG